MANFYEKDLNALSDLINYERSAAQKCEFYANQLTDPETQEVLKGVAKCHQMRLTSLYEYLSK